MRYIFIILTVFMVIFLGCVNKAGKSTNDSVLGENNTVVAESDWCTPGEIIDSNNSDTGFTIKGFTVYENQKVCEAEWKYEGGSVTEYFTEDKTIKMIYKDIDGNIVDENSTNESNTSTNTKVK